jgi:tetratricopeptide (TPR) repeat protein
MPRLPGNDSLSQRLIEFVPALDAASVRLLSTSLNTLPAVVRAALSPTAIHEIATPALTEPEAEELFRSFGAPQAFLTAGRVRFINGLASGHPLLLSLAAEYLDRNNWRLDDARLDGLLRGEHASRLAEDVVTQLVQTLDETRRELLYRLTLPIGTFTADAVTALAAVAPPVSRARECLNDLLGAWVQRDTEERLAISPLVRVVGAGDLLPQTRLDCHLVLAERIVGGRMSPFDAEIAIGHFVQAREVGRAGTLFLILLQKVAELPASADVRSTVAMWADLPLPGEMDAGLRLLIRSLQISVLPRFGRRIDFILTDIDRLLEETTEEHGWAIAALGVYAVTSLAEADPDRALGYLRLALTLPEEILGPTGDNLSLPADLHFDELLWSMIQHVNTATRLRRWLAAAESLPGPRLERLFQSSLARLGSLVLADRLSMEQLRKPPAERHWEEVLPSLDELANWAVTKTLPLLWACAVRSKVYALGEQGRIDEALAIGEEALASASGDPVAHFLIAGAMGRFLVRARRFLEARPKLHDALAQPVNDYPHERMLFLLAASHSYGVENPEAGVQYAREAVTICRAEEEIPDLEVARAYAELAVAQYLDSGASAALEAWSEAAEKLFAVREEDDQWKDSFVIFAHMTGYLSSLAATGHPPAHTRDGEEFAAPERGLFLLTHPDRPAYYRAGSEPGIMWALAQYAWAVGDREGAAKWLARASDAVSNTRMSYLQATIARDLIPSLILSDRYEDAVDAGIRSCQALQVFRSRPSEEQDPFGEGFDLDAAVAGLTPEHRAQVEICTLIFAVVPAFMHIGALATENREHAYSAARSLAAVCREVGEHAHDSRLWSGVGAVLERASSDVRRARDLYDLSITFEGDNYRPLRVLGYLASSIHGNVDESFAAQLATIETLFAWYPPGSQTYERLLLPYLEKFWTSRFREARFQFRAPSLVEAELAQAVSRPPQERLRAILRAVRLGVNVSGLEEALHWLSRDPS